VFSQCCRLWRSLDGIFAAIGVPSEDGVCTHGKVAKSLEVAALCIPAFGINATTRYDTRMVQNPRVLKTESTGGLSDIRYRASRTRC